MELYDYIMMEITCSKAKVPHIDPYLKMETDSPAITQKKGVTDSI